MKKLILVIIVLVATGMNAFAADKSRREIRGDNYFFQYSFDKAIRCYSHTKNLSVDGQRKLAQSYYNVDKYPQSEAAYAKLLMEGGQSADDYFNYILVLKRNGKEAEAETWMNKFAQLYPGDLRAVDYTEDANLLPKISADEGNYRITTLNMNTNAKDFGPSYYNGRIAFSSNRTKGQMVVRKNNWDGGAYYDIYVSDMDGIQLKNPSRLDKKLNGIWHDGPVSFNKEGDYIAFTRNNYNVKRKDKIVQLEIYFSKYLNGKWSDPEPFALNSPDYSVGQPNLNADGTIMYFTSDMPGGYGGSDIYRVKKIADGTWGAAENLGSKVNTEGDEMFPFYQEKNNMLFFSSNGLFGLGGLDIFYCTVNGSQTGDAENAGAPLNTKDDDFGLIVDDNMKNGYFCSNREGGSGDDDIYAVSIMKDFGPAKKVEGFALDKSGKAIPETFVTLLDDQGVILDSMTTKDDGSYSFPVASGKYFRLTGRKETYQDGENTFNTLGSELIVKSNVILTKKVVAEVIPKKDSNLIVMNNIYFDLDKYNIRPDAARELDKIVKLMNDDPNMVIEIRSYTDCRASMAYNQVLSDNRAKATLKYIRKRIKSPERIYGKGYSETHLVNSCDCSGDAASYCTDAQYEQNRRTEFVIVRR